MHFTLVGKGEELKLTLLEKYRIRGNENLKLSIILKYQFKGIKILSISYLLPRANLIV